MSQLGSSDEGIVQAVRELQAEAYITLETMKVLTDQIRGSSPAGRQPRLLPLKITAAMHTETEVRGHHQDL